MDDLKSDNACEWVAAALTKRPRLRYIFESARMDRGRGLNARAAKIDVQRQTLVLRSKFGETNIFYLYGRVRSDDFDWISTFDGQGEIHCEKDHKESIEGSILAKAISRFDDVSYYKLRALISPSKTFSSEIRSVGADEAPKAARFVHQFSDDPILYPGMFELPAFAGWQEDQIVALAATLYINDPMKAAQIGNFLTHPDHRGKGFASFLGYHLVEHLQKRKIDEIRLEVYSDNIQARRVYENLGFAVEDQGLMTILSDRKISAAVD